MKSKKNNNKAYSNIQFLHSPWARSIRLLTEYQYPLSRFVEEGITGTIVFFGSARIPEMSKAEPGKKIAQLANYYEEARKLSYRLTQWCETLTDRSLLICSGGGPGIMEAANRGASEAGGRSIGLNISLPFEQVINPYVPPELDIEFHYFFFRKYWFINMAQAIVVFPGGFGTLDEFMETLTLIQTKKINRKIPIVVFGKAFWQKVINFNALVEFGVIAPDDVHLFQFCDTVEEAFAFITTHVAASDPLSDTERGILPS